MSNSHEHTFHQVKMKTKSVRRVSVYSDSTSITDNNRHNGMVSHHPVTFVSFGVTSKAQI